MDGLACGSREKSSHKGQQVLPFIGGMWPFMIGLSEAPFCSPGARPVNRARRTNPTLDGCAEGVIARAPPQPARELGHALDGEARQPAQRRGQVLAHRHPQAPAAFNHREEVRNSGSGPFAAQVDPVLAAQCHRSHRVFGRVVGQFDLRVVQKPGQPAPPRQGIIAGSDILSPRKLDEPIDGCLRALLPRCGPTIQAGHVTQNGSSKFLVYRAPPRTHQEF